MKIHTLPVMARPTMTRLLQLIDLLNVCVTPS